jgi:hypothetical protein
VNEYKSRKFDEDLKRIDELGGLEGIATKLKTDFRLGLSATSVEDLNN